ncbi:MAG: sigma-70 family RNA polymerase sigma factor [Sandaracinaceae bacterium]|nr:sigma-70 family RNA polymerase sigma factor [Sandaracinaceae bacterium]
MKDDLAGFCTRYEALLRSVARKLHVGTVAHRVELEDLIAYGRVGLIEAHRRLSEPEPPLVSERVVAWVHVRNAMLDGLYAMTGWRRQSARVERELALTEFATVHPVRSQRQAEDALQDGLHQVLTISLLCMAAQTLADPDHEADPELRALRRHLCGHIVHAASKLGDPLKSIVHAHYFERRTLREIARELGFSTRYTTELHLRALTLLREPLAELSSAFIYAKGSLGRGSA